MEKPNLFKSTKKVLSEYTGLSPEENSHMITTIMWSVAEEREGRGTNGEEYDDAEDVSTEENLEKFIKKICIRFHDFMVFADDRKTDEKK